LISLTNRFGYQNIFLASIKNKFMQTKSALRLSVAVILMAMLASCHKKNSQGRFVPSDAAVTVVVDGKSIASKLPWDDIKQNVELQKLLLDTTTPAIVKSILNNPATSGVDLQSNLILFVEKDSIGGYLGVEGTVKDPALFKTFMHQIDSSGTESQSNDITLISHTPSCVGWDKDKFVYILDAPSLGNSNNFSNRMIADSISNINRNRDIGATCKSIFALDEKNSLAVNEKFSKLVNENGEIHFWVNSGNLYAQMFTAGPLAMLNMEDLYKDNVTTATLSFGDGKISLTTRSYTNDKVLAIYKKCLDGKINDDMIQRMPGKEVDGLMAMNFKPEGIKDILKLINADGLANGGLTQVGLTLDDITSAFKGDFLFGASDFSIKMDSVPYNGYNMPKETSAGNYVFAASIGNKESFTKVITTLKNLLTQTQGPDAINHLPFSFDNNNDFFVITNTKDNTAQFLAGPNTIKFDFISDIDGAPFGGYINIQSLLKGAGSLIDKDSSSQALYDASLKMWDNVYMKGGNIDGSISTGNVEINLIDKSTNSLKQLSEYVAKVSKVIKAKEDKQAAEVAKFEDDMKTDTTIKMPN
jgi:hypothetical protein